MSLWVYVKDCDAPFNRAVGAGAKVAAGPMGAMQDQFWGDRSGTFDDPYGYRLVDRDAQGGSLAPGTGAAAEGVHGAIRAAADPLTPLSF